MVPHTSFQSPDSAARAAMVADHDAIAGDRQQASHSRWHASVALVLVLLVIAMLLVLTPP